MGTAVIPPQAQFSEAAEYRNVMYSQSMPRLQHLAWRALNVHGQRNDEMVAVCIQVDSVWRDVVDMLMPDQDWQPIRDRGEDPIALGTASWDICQIVAEKLPNIADTALEVPPAGMMKVIVLSDEGCTIYELKPRKDVLTIN
ncbi:hypothetical protein A3I99_01610 [Candidatus Kaiserbacteria bacterium RIFCSPLOWO2_02_FULL_45_11b]|uniref:Uncharacterized protein n=1 Tax=Candidatus Kaiserbacteria bacterium RIFCSPLOWO2_12_FULL_45_26 TaxID=1798525 RepID=A0A1F6FFW3_9BACT|nr:MAG: hypothetical protein A2Z56_03950 [Candidatus Kaiserbacteria bacterium RIFCSPHIGHO2_12_45_16]OGG70527.1 MAG: hypothetical protein A2929_04855 [Candidatus Kaiserbacteria bacterium RIFCSPLOWO2_01_FULL_45_25]OGG81012.1 MAG: hypothetical protein A3I99_01610 [Candidatus Kaiserbacteria bacterium RIFCSPLOWO2_02_FULL_45_11b]OGG84755.1 MAG: hypothetical protein A3G90_01560 [Candidatus Kaiserbacteria bacterium RIFCSPLOWO2_12_FULL_45_26]